MDNDIVQGEEDRHTEDKGEKERLPLSRSAVRRLRMLRNGGRLGGSPGKARTIKA